MRIAFSTLACPEWTLSQVFEFGEDSAFDGVELRTFAEPSMQFACEPLLTSTDKLRRMASGAGFEMAALATSCRFDQPVFPPVLGRALPTYTRPISDAQAFVRFADDLECPIVRVFAFEPQGRESLASFFRRVGERLRAVADSARARNAVVAVENAGAFGAAEDLAALLDEVDHPRLRASYNVAVGAWCGDDPAEAATALAGRTSLLRIKDVDASGMPSALGSGEVPNREAIEAFFAQGFRGWGVYEWDRAWAADLDATIAPAAEAVPAAGDLLRSWVTPLVSVTSEKLRGVRTPDAPVTM
ncbi:MAG: sugar phosphate isomerase/epimerase [Planctomycetota bacterium]